MSEAPVVGRNSLSTSLSLFLPFPKAPGFSSSLSKHAHRLAVYILSSPGLRLPADSMEMAELCLRRLWLVRTLFQFPCHSSTPSQRPL